MDPTAILKRGRASREAKMGRKRDRSRAHGGVDGGDGDVDMDATTAVILAYEGEVSTATSIASNARRKNIARAVFKSAQITSIVKSRLHSRH